MSVLTDKEIRQMCARDDLTTFSPGQRANICRALFEHIEHGDEGHRAWLKRELEKFFSVNA